MILSNIVYRLKGNDKALETYIRVFIDLRSAEIASKEE